MSRRKSRDLRLASCPMKEKWSWKTSLPLLSVKRDDQLTFVSCFKSTLRGYNQKIRHYRGLLGMKCLLFLNLIWCSLTLRWTSTRWIPPWSRKTALLNSALIALQGCFRSMKSILMEDSIRGRIQTLSILTHLRNFCWVTPLCLRIRQNMRNSNQWLRMVQRTSFSMANLLWVAIESPSNLSYAVETHFWDATWSKSQVSLLEQIWTFEWRSLKQWWAC